MVEGKDVEKKSRSHEHLVEIEASPEVVWEAVTTAEGLQNWFPAEAEVERGEGGRITYIWDGLEGSCEITVWEEGEHLRTSWPALGDMDRELVVDWYLEEVGEGTRLRLVHSGFGPGASWDDEFDSTSRGWEFELRCLKHYLEFHRDESRTFFYLSHESREDPEVIWRKISHPTSGLLRFVGGEPRDDEEVVVIRLGEGENLDGRLLRFDPPLDFAMTIEPWREGVLRYAFEDCFGEPQAIVWLSLWGLSREEEESVREELQSEWTQFWARSAAARKK